jgi:outer membrane receptor protein involved in Fe transport
MVSNKGKLQKEYKVAQDLKNFRRTALLGSAATLVASLALGQTTFAQDTAADDVSIEEVVVTGSRIARDPNLAAPSPVSVVSSVDLKLSGESDIAEVLKDVPALLTTTSSQGSVDGIFAPSVGSSVLQLRGLGNERTLTLVDGRRHVGGVQGSSAVDVGSIPNALVERVEILTGGASAIYGADAVSGVVNFILKDDFEGIEIGARTGISGEGDGEQIDANFLYGQNFGNDRGNFTVGLNYTRREGIRFGDRSFSRNNGISDDLPNPDADSPFSRVILPQPTFSISSNRGVIVAGDFSDPGLDLDNNGVSDCQQSTVGQNSEFAFGGCWVVNDDGSVRPFQDGLVSGAFNQFGGDGIPNSFDEDFLIPDDEKYSANFTGNYQLTDSMSFFVEAKYVYQSTDFGGPLNTFYDLLTVAPDNPYIPTELQGLADSTGGLFITRDPTDLGPNINTNKRETYRVVAGIEGDFSNGWTYELSGNYGRFERETIDRNRVIMDRFFAAIDVTTDANGNPVCRSALDGSSPPTTPFDIPLFDTGFFTFNPDDGSCVPANILGGPNSISSEAVDFITTTIHNKRVLEQTVINGFIAGDLADFVSLPGGEIGFVLGAEYRKESADAAFDPLVRGVLPITTQDGNAGDLVSELDAFRQTSLVFDPSSLVQNEGGSYDVKEVFAEVSLPILSGEKFFEQLSIDAAARLADYSTVGSAFTWTVGGTWAPISDIQFRGTYSVAIRAPNVNELFAPSQGAFFRPNDPCDQSAIDDLIAAGNPNGAVRQANCAADGIPAGFTDPLSARFSGVTSGNADLQEETGKTFTVGTIIQPRFAPGLTLSVDYWNITIEDAISAVSAQDIVDNCYDSANFPNQFCGLFSRNTDPNSPQFNGFNFLRQTQINFASLETSGIDVSGRYQFDIDENQFTLSAGGTWVNNLDQFFDPGEPTANDPELGELQRPEWAGSASLTWQRGPVLLSWQTRYQSEQALRSVEIETADITYGPNGFADEVFLHDFSFSYEVKEGFEVYGGVNNVTNKKPFVTEQAFPVNPLGRYFFLGVNVRFD